MPSATTPRLQRRRAFFRRLRLYGYVSLAVLLVVGIGYLIFGSPLFKIGELTVTGAPDINQDELIAQLKTQVAAGDSGWLGADNYLAWPETIEYSAPRVKSVSIEKSFWSRGITVTVTPRKRYTVWCAGTEETNCYWTDETGTPFEYAPVSDGQLVQTVFSPTTTSVSLGSPVLPTEDFTVVREILDGIQKLDLTVTRVTINEQSQELRVDTGSGARIIFSLRFDPKPTALPALARFIKKPGLAKLEYVNLTVENRAFVKNR